MSKARGNVKIDAQIRVLHVSGACKRISRCWPDGEMRSFAVHGTDGRQQGLAWFSRSGRVSFELRRDILGEIVCLRVYFCGAELDRRIVAAVLSAARSFTKAIERAI